MSTAVTTMATSRSRRTRRDRGKINFAALGRPCRAAAPCRSALSSCKSSTASTAYGCAGRAPHAARRLIIRPPGLVNTSGGPLMQTVIRPITVAIAASLARWSGVRRAARKGIGDRHVPDDRQRPPARRRESQPRLRPRRPSSPRERSSQFDATGQALTLSTSKGEQHFTVSPAARLRDSSHAISPADLGKLTGHKATVRYRESGGARNVESIHVSSSAPKTSAKE